MSNVYDKEINKIKENLTQVYWERNQLVCYLSKIFPAWIEQHSKNDDKWENDWRNIIFIEFPEGKYCWHIHDNEIVYFLHLAHRKTDSWDGSTIKEKYDKLRNKSSCQCRKK